jgi:hypothetical protein
MDESVAVGIAQGSRPAYEVPAEYVVRHVERRFIELGDTPAAPGEDTVRVRDLRVWVVRFGAGIAWIDLAVDEVTARVVRVERSRS